jgi:dienelactone hydrolase
VLARLVTLATLLAPVIIEGQSTTRAPGLWAELTPGSYAVGYRQLASSAGVVHSWYPTPESATPLRFSDYAASSQGELRAFLGRVGIGKPAVDSLFESALLASNAPAAAAGPFPLVLVAQGNAQDVVDQVILCEYLASLGFVVASTPSPMTRVPMQREDQIGEMSELQATELAAAIIAASMVLPVDRDRVAIVGHSFGARAALLLVMRQSRIRALVSLDGGIGTATAVDHFRRAPSFRADASLPPSLHFYEVLDQFMAPDFTLLRSLKVADLDLAATADMRHTHFTTYGFLAGSIPDIARATRATPATSTAVARVVKRTGEFLKTHLR